jgi:ABC-2 type transport system permease protein
MIPVVILPKLLSIRNRWRHNRLHASQFARDVIILLFCVAVTVSIFQGTVAALEKIKTDLSFAYLPAPLPLGLVLLFLFLMLLFSNSIAALGAFYLGRDLDLLLASPLSKPRFFFGKMLEIFGGSSWMAVIFGLPAILGFASAYQAGWDYGLIVVATLIPYFVLPTALSIVVITLFTVMVPANRTREILFFVFALVLMGIYLIGKLVFPSNASFQNANDLLRIVSILSVPNTTWMPSYWAATCLGETLEHSGKNILPYLAMLYSTAFGLTALAYFLVRTFHFTAYSRARDNRHGLKLSSRTSHSFFVRATPIFDQQFRAVIMKEFKIFARDMTQAVQLLLLLGLCMIYLYNFRILQSINGLPETTRMWWQGFLVVSNLAMGAFVITAVCTRFVFPSLSLEGQSFWILQTSPMSIKDLLHAKFWCWLVPVATISSIIFASGALAINAGPHVVIINALASWVICYGIVGLAVGMGAFFANFDWEHTSQLAASFGSLVFMLFSTLLIFLNLLPAGLLIFLRTLRMAGYTFTQTNWYVAVGCSALLLVYLNYVATRWSLRLGETALRERMGS